MDYETTHVKRNTETGDVAVRTIFDATMFPENVWLVATPGSGARTASADYVEGWEDIYTPPAADE